MILGQTVFVGLDIARSRNRARDEGDAHRLEAIRRQRTRCESRPEAVAVPGHDAESRDAMIAHKVMDLRALHGGVAMVLYDHVGESGSGPGFAHAGRDILKVDAPI